MSCLVRMDSVRTHPKLLTFSRVMELLELCGDTPPEFFFRSRPDLTANEQGSVYFLKYCSSDSPRTIRSYARNLCRFLAFLHEEGVYNFLDVRPEDVTAYASSLIANDLRPATIEAYLACVRSFFKLLVEEGVLLDNPSRALRRRVKRELAKQGKKNRRAMSGHVTKSLSTRHMDHLLAETRSNAPVRDGLLISTMYYTGIRSAELRGLKWGSLFETDDGWFFCVLGKGNKQREVFVPDHLVEDIMVFRRVTYNVPAFVPAPSIAGMPIFSPAGNLGQPLSYDSVYQIVKKWGERCGLKLSPHSLRHTNATHLRKRGASLEELQAALGHENISTTRKYLHVDGRENAAGKLFDR